MGCLSAEEFSLFTFNVITDQEGVTSAIFLFSLYLIYFCSIPPLPPFLNLADFFFFFVVDDVFFFLYILFIFILKIHLFAF